MKLLTLPMAVGLLAITLFATPILAEETIKVGILYSLSGTMAISETTLKDTMLMLIEEQNKKGGLLGNQGIKADAIPIIAFSVGEEELSGIDTKPLVGHLAAWNYFMSVQSPANAAFIKTWKAFIKNDKRVTNDPMEAHYIGFNMWVKAVEKAGTIDPKAVQYAIIGVTVPNLSAVTQR